MSQESVNQERRRELISKNLGIKPINHGQVYAFQVAIPDSRKQTISLEHRQAIEQSLLAHQSNLISLIIRRTDAYADEDIEYELVYGADWLQIAQELQIEKVWAWVFDLTDEQAIAAIAEMESLTSSSSDGQADISISRTVDSDIASLIEKKLQLATDSIKSSIASLLTGIRNDLDEKLKVLTYRIDHLSDTSTCSNELGAVLEKLDAIQQQITSPQKTSKRVTVENRINLLEASDRAIEDALKRVNTRNQDISVAIKAIQYWKKSEQGLTWKNLERSAMAKTKSPDKIQGFAKGIYDRLLDVADIPEGDSAE